MLSITSLELWAIFTPLLLSLLAIGGLMLDLFAWRDRPRNTGIFIFIGLIAVLVCQFYLHFFRLNYTNDPGIPFGGQYYFDVYSIYFNYLFIIAAAIGTLMSLRAETGAESRGEYYILLVFATIGMCMMAAAHDFLILFIGLEIMSISIYILVGSRLQSLLSGEGSIKYLLLGAFASAILLYGMALVYGVTGETSYRVLSDAIAFNMGADPQVRLVMLIGIMMIFTAFFFKVAAVPFHMWTPDAYQGAPTPITAVMATGVKAAAFAGLLRLCITAFTPLWGMGTLYNVLYVLAVITMVYGNFVAISQTNLKRMLAYSSIAHAGYLLVGVTAVIASGQYYILNPYDEGMLALKYVRISGSSILFYLMIYTLMNLGAFGVITAISRQKKDGESLNGFSGIAARRPGLAAVMAICMFSLAGIPPLAGFAGKFYVFQAAIANRLYILAIIGVLASVVSAYYYLRVIVVMYFSKEEVPFDQAADQPSGAMVANIILASAVVLLGLFPQPVIDIINRAFDLGMMSIPIH